MELETGLILGFMLVNGLVIGYLDNPHYLFAYWWLSMIVLVIMRYVTFRNDIRSKVLKIKKNSPNAKDPERASKYAAGLDIFSAEPEDVEISPHTLKLINTDLSVECPPGYYVQLKVRSGMCTKKNMDVLAGVIDEDYRGPVKVVLCNTSLHTPFIVHPGDPIAQMVLVKCGARIPFVMCDSLSPTERDQGGFGSTDKKHT